MSAVCPHCHSEFSKIIGASPESDKMNNFGRREITFTVEHKDVIHYNPYSRLYECDYCGLTFSFSEFTSQKLKLVEVKQPTLSSFHAQETSNKELQK
jgi:hypothetical protein